MTLNVEQVENEFKLLSKVQDKSLAFNEIFEDIDKKTQILLAKKHLFAVMSLASIIDKLIKDSGVKDEDIERIEFSEHVRMYNKYELSISLEPSVSADSDKVYTLGSEIDDQMHILGEPKFLFFSDLANKQINDFEHFRIEGKISEVGNSFIKMALNEDLLNLYETLTFKNNLENALPGKEPKATKKNKM